MKASSSGSQKSVLPHCPHLVNATGVSSFTSACLVHVALLEGKQSKSKGGFPRARIPMLFDSVCSRVMKRYTKRYETSSLDDMFNPNPQEQALMRGPICWDSICQAVACFAASFFGWTYRLSARGTLLSVVLVPTVLSEWYCAYKGTLTYDMPSKQ